MSSNGMLKLIYRGVKRRFLGHPSRGLLNDKLCNVPLNHESIKMMRCWIRFGGRGRISNSLFLNHSPLTVWEVFPRTPWNLKCNYHLSISSSPPVFHSSRYMTENAPFIILNLRVMIVWVLVKDLSWRDLDLIVERGPVPLYQKGPLDVIMPVLYGLLLGFGGTFFTGLLILLALVHISNRDQDRRRPPPVSSSSC